MAVRMERSIADRTLSIETGRLAKQASGAALVQYGGTVVLVASVGAPGREGLDFFPLTVDYRERTYAAGKYPGGFIKREGRPSTKEILTSRLTDRPIRPLFPEGYTDEVQIQSIVLSADKQNDPDILSVLGASASLMLAPNIPFAGPIGAVRVGRIDGEFVLMPTADDLEESDLDLVVAGNESSVLMIEGFAKQMSEDDMVQAILVAQREIQELCAMQRRLVEEAGIVKEEAPAIERNPMIDVLRERYYDEMRATKQTEGKHARAEAMRALRERIVAELVPGAEGDGQAHSLPSAGLGDGGSAVQTMAGPTVEQVQAAFHDLEARVVRDLILDGTRPDGRGPKELREIHCEVGLLPRTHGSALFQRGETQAVVAVTLGTTSDEQRVDGLMEEYSKKFMLDYNFPPFSVGEVRPIRGPGRREIGHGALAERSLKPVTPPPEKFPYTIRLVSEILESNGSSSMATVCGGTLAMMDGGVPISHPVAGVSIGLVKEGDRYELLTDIIGDEDHFGDMDFKVAGTQHGITGIQLDLKIAGINEEIIRGTLAQAREARIEILRHMLRTIPRPRADISPYAPRLLQLRISPDKIGLLIGPGGKTIRAIQEDTGATIEVEDDGTVTIACVDAEGAQRARDRVEALTAEVEIGRIYEGTVMSIKDFGCFVEILPGKDGLCHISELAEGYVKTVTDVVKVGDRIPVKVINIDEQNRVKLSRKRALQEMGEAAKK